ncbi:MAG: glycosyltransferase family 4 protein [Candidatus Omnitrophica bacterium]|nr:glycosyltransferase family 4 protein [Candidatus Omnitrophota bacterium]
MNILFLANHLNTGGITSYVFTLACGLKKKGHRVFVASGGGELVQRFINEGITHIDVPMRTKQALSPQILFSAIKLSKIIRKENIDLLHSQSRTTQVLGCLLQHRARIAHISTCHGFFKPRFLRKFFPFWGERIIAVSDSVKEHLINDFGVKDERINVVHSGIDVERFSELPNSDLTIQLGVNRRQETGDPLIGVVARLSEEKGHIYLIEAMQQVIKEFPQAKLLIAGEGKMKKVLISLAGSLGIEKNVSFIPTVKDAREIYALIDIFVLPSTKEGLGLALMEAMASEKPVIGTAVGGIKTLIKNGFNGLLVAPADPAALAGAIIRLIRNQQERKILAESAKTFIAQNFSQEKMAQETERVYLECLKNVKL